MPPEDPDIDGVPAEEESEDLEQEFKDIRLVALDLDGTLIRSDKKLSIETVKTLKRCAEHDVRVVLASSRPPKAMREIYDVLELDTYIINYNGALIYEPKSGEFVRRYQMPQDLVLKIITLAREIVPRCLVRLDLEDRWITDRKELADDGTHPGTVPVPDEVGPLYQILKEGVSRLAIVANPAALEQIFKLINLQHGDHFSLAHSNERVMQIMHPDADKLNALIWVVKQYGLNRNNVMAIGDAENDHGILEWSGLGAAVANADGETKRLANVVVPSNDEDGVGYAIRKYVFREDV